MAGKQKTHFTKISMKTLLVTETQFPSRAAHLNYLEMSQTTFPTTPGTLSLGTWVLVFLPWAGFHLGTTHRGFFVYQPVHIGLYEVGSFLYDFHIFLQHALQLGRARCQLVTPTSQSTNIKGKAGQ